VTGQLRYGIQLMNSSVEYDIDVASYFIALGHAQLSCCKLDVSSASYYIVVRHSGYVLVSINEVNLHQARLV